MTFILVLTQVKEYCKSSLIQLEMKIGMVESVQCFNPEIKSPKTSFTANIVQYDEPTEGILEQPPGVSGINGTFSN